MKTKALFTIITAVLFNLLTAQLFASVLGVAVAPVFAVQMALSLIPVGRMSGCLRDGLNREIWLPDIVEQFVPDTSFVNEARDLDAWTDNGFLNIQEAGVNPDVIVNNEVWPIPIMRREDVPHRIEMKRFDTVNTVHVNAIEIEESSAKRQSVIEGHKKSLQEKFARMAGYNWSPTENTDTTPVITVEGGKKSVINNTYYSMTYDQLLQLETMANMMDMPTEGRILLLHPWHAADLRKQDLEMYKAFFNDGRMFSFKIYITAMTPRYNGTTGKRVAYDAPVNSTDAISSTFYFRDAVGRAKSDFDMYVRLQDPEYRGDVLGFNMRGLALPITGKYLGAIITKKA